MMVLISGEARSHGGSRGTANGGRVDLSDNLLDHLIVAQSQLRFSLFSGFNGVDQRSLDVFESFNGFSNADVEVFKSGVFGFPFLDDLDLFDQ